MVAISNDILVVANRLGSALGSSPVVREYLQAREALLQDAGVGQLEEKIQQVYQDLVTRQRNGEMLFPHEVNAFYDLRDQYSRHPLVMEYGRCETLLKAMFGEVGKTINSILSVDYTQLAE
jgi:cell fate (sporulation/competence/biofilm development) regulator YlbF (YheA/YmcA/DUF963 family)